MLIPMSVARPRRALYYAGVCLAASIAGAGIGYWLGAAAMDSVGQQIVALYGLQEKLEQMFLWYKDWDAWIVMIAGFTPIPYKLITLSAGAAHVDLGVFFLASILSRGARFFLVAGLLMAWGERAAHFIERHFDTLTLIFAALLVGVALLSLH
ncbi:MAG: DedA family protein [Candidatus Dadabacteria bacterium]|nr:MAG: DedA family protein [Candidatus Dadabacteria bacterium]